MDGMSVRIKSGSSGVLFFRLRHWHFNNGDKQRHWNILFITFVYDEWKHVLSEARALHSGAWMRAFIYLFRSKDLSRMHRCDKDAKFWIADAMAFKANT